MSFEALPTKTVGALLFDEITLYYVSEASNKEGWNFDLQLGFLQSWSQALIWR